MAEVTGAVRIASSIPALPPLRKGRKRVARSMEAAGDCSLILLRREGQEIPDNVVRLFPLPEPTPIARSPELALLLILYCNMPIERQDDIKLGVRATAEATRDPHFLAVANMLEGGRV